MFFLVCKEIALYYFAQILQMLILFDNQCLSSLHSQVNYNILLQFFNIQYLLLFKNYQQPYQNYRYQSMENYYEKVETNTQSQTYLKKQASEDQFQRLLKELKLNEASNNPKLIDIYGTSNKEIICKKIILNQQIDLKIQQKAQYIRSFHGTNKNALVSIAKFGLKAAGQNIENKVIQTVGGHVPLNQTEYNIHNWAGAIFSTPSIFYACHQIYSIQFQANEADWFPAVELKILKNSFTEHDHPFEKRMIKFKFSDMRNLIIRNQNSEDVIVVALLFLNKKALESCQESYEQFTRLILNGNNKQNCEQTNQYN